MKKTRYIAEMGILFSLACALQFLESLIPIPLPMGIKAGISSIVVMYTLVSVGFGSAMTVAVLKSGFVFVTRGASAFCMSMCGGVLSVLVMGVLLALTKNKKNGTGIIFMSVTGGVFHNIGQLAAASFFAGSIYTFSYLPVLIIAGIASGIVTGIIFRFLISNIGRKKCSLERSNINNE